MIKKASFFLLLLLSFINLEAKTPAVDFEGRLAAFFAQSKNFKDVYGKACPSYQVQAALEMQKNLKWWNNFSYIDKGGSSDPLGVSTRLKVFSASTGLKYLMHFSETAEVYLGCGPVYSWLKEKNNSQFIRQVNRRNGMGVIIKSGITRVQKRIILSLFVDYQFLKLRAGNSIGDRKINLRGLYVGFR